MPANLRTVGTNEVDILRSKPTLSKAQIAPEQIVAMPMPMLDHCSPSSSNFGSQFAEVKIANKLLIGDRALNPIPIYSTP